MSPPLTRAQACSIPTETRMTVPGTATAVGVFWQSLAVAHVDFQSPTVVVAAPNFRPQQSTPPSIRVAQTWSSCAEICRYLVPPATTAGPRWHQAGAHCEQSWVLSATAPPSCPRCRVPQQATRVSVRRAHPDMCPSDVPITFCTGLSPLATIEKPGPASLTSTESLPRAPPKKEPKQRTLLSVRVTQKALHSIATEEAELAPAISVTPTPIGWMSSPESSEPQ